VFLVQSCVSVFPLIVCVQSILSLVAPSVCCFPLHSSVYLSSSLASVGYCLCKCDVTLEFTIKYLVSLTILCCALSITWKCNNYKVLDGINFVDATFCTVHMNESLL